MPVRRPVKLSTARREREKDKSKQQGSRPCQFRGMEMCRHSRHRDFRNFQAALPCPQLGRSHLLQPRCRVIQGQLVVQSPVENGQRQEDQRDPQEQASSGLARLRHGSLNLDDILRARATTLPGLALRIPLLRLVPPTRFFSSALKSSIAHSGGCGLTPASIMHAARSRRQTFRSPDGRNKRP